jgi:hypothetical protein
MKTDRSGKLVAQVSEILCKLTAYNLTVGAHEKFEHGIASTFIGNATLWS